MGCSAHETTIPARGKALVDTDISIAVPIGTCKFSLSSRAGVRIANSLLGLLQMDALLLAAVLLRKTSLTLELV